MKQVLLALAMLGLVIGPALAETFGHIPGVPARLGAGFNVLEPDTVYPACLTASDECQAGAKDSILCLAPTTTPPQNQTPEPTPLEFAPSTTFSIREIRSKYEYFKELNVSASVSGSYGAFSGGASFSYHSIDDIDENSISWAVTAKSELGSFALANPQLRPEFEGLSNGELISSCGSQYVAEVDRGVLASVLYTFHSRSEQKLREISASLSAGFNAGFGGVSGGVSLQETIESFRQHGQVSIRVFAIGGEGLSALDELIKENPSDLDKVKERLATYVNGQVADRSAILGFRTSSFGKLIGAPEIDPDYSSYLYFLDRMDEYRGTLEDHSRRLDEVLYRQDDFELQRADLLVLENRLTCELKSINVALQGCRLHFDNLNSLFANGVSTDDETARIAMSYGIISQPGTTSTPELISVGNSQEIRDCAEQLPIEEAALVSAMSSQKGVALTEQTGQFCTYDFDYDFLASLRRIPDTPFVVSYSFDTIAGGSPVFPSAFAEAMYLQYSGAEKVDFVRVMTAEDQLVHHADNVNHLGTFGFAVTLPPALRGEEVTLESVMVSGNSFTTVIEVPKRPI